MIKLLRVPSEIFFRALFVRDGKQFLKIKYVLRSVDYVFATIEIPADRVGNYTYYSGLSLS